jgi:hypothetical protein
MRFGFHRRTRLELSFQQPKQLDAGRFTQMLPTLDDYDPNSLLGWLVWEQQGRIDRLKNLGSFLFGAHHNFETLLRHLGLSKEDIKFLRAEIIEHYLRGKGGQELQRTLQGQLKQTRRQIEELKEKRRQFVTERDEANRGVVYAKVVLVETVMMADRRIEEIDRLLTLREATEVSYVGQLALIQPEPKPRLKKSAKAVAQESEDEKREGEGELNTAEATA